MAKSGLIKRGEPITPSVKLPPGIATVTTIEWLSRQNSRELLMTKRMATPLKIIRLRGLKEIRAVRISSLLGRSRKLYSLIKLFLTQ